jgi:mannose-6-phosphate isomerase-like protein (cupin superfamily)/8-oxo-dGTP pyrophosphatase MutT (NUDIX family)
VGYPGHTVEVPPEATPAARARAGALAALIREIPHDPFARRAGLLAALEGVEPAGAELRGHVCATAWVLDPTATQVLLIRHRRLGWCTPGGHVEGDEEPVAAACRELHEETGVRPERPGAVPAVLHPAVFPSGPAGPAHWHHNLGFRFVADPAEPLIPERGSPAAWFPVDDLPEPRVDDLTVVLPLLAATGATPSTVRLRPDPDVLAPDGSEVRVLARGRAASLAHFLLPAGETSIAVRHRQVEEVWYVLGGRGELWRDGLQPPVAQLEAGVSLVIPPGTSFQFRSLGPEPLTVVAATIPPWPLDRVEADPVEGRWPPTVSAEDSA